MTDAHHSAGGMKKHKGWTFPSLSEAASVLRRRKEPPQSRGAEVKVDKHVDHAGKMVADGIPVSERLDHLDAWLMQQKFRKSEVDSRLLLSLTVDSGHLDRIEQFWRLDGNAAKIALVFSKNAEPETPSEVTILVFDQKFGQSVSEAYRGANKSSISFEDVVKQSSTELLEAHLADTASRGNGFARILHARSAGNLANNNAS